MKKDDFYSEPIKVYVKTDARGGITEIASSVFLDDTDGWTEIDSGHGDKFAHAQNHYLEKPLFDENDGIPLYKWDGERVIQRTEEEIASERAAILNSPERRASEIKQQLTELDNQAIRPLRAILAGTPTDDDKDKLAAIETQAVKLRDELTKLELH
ncbi:MAG: hypothetical protein J1F04_01480 [Oscillospiraceae bacterium]|nr:hypothetical protein [Oscillospiraceae bacterium]